MTSRGARSAGHHDHARTPDTHTPPTSLSAPLSASHPPPRLSCPPTHPAGPHTPAQRLTPGGQRRHALRTPASTASREPGNRLWPATTPDPCTPHRIRPAESSRSRQRSTTHRECGHTTSHRHKSPRSSPPPHTIPSPRIPAPMGRDERVGIKWREKPRTTTSYKASRHVSQNSNIHSNTHIPTPLLPSVVLAPSDPFV